MGVGGISLWQLLIVLAIVILLFGTKRLRTLGSDLGASLRGFKRAMKDGEDETLKPDPPAAIDDEDKSAEQQEARSPDSERR